MSGGTSVINCGKIVSTTIAHNRERTIAGALACVVSYVDECLILDTGITDNTIAVAREIAGDKLVVLAWPWQQNFSKARNRVLDWAAERRASWAVMLDTDQRIQWKAPPSTGDDFLRKALSACGPSMPADSSRGVDVLTMRSAGGYTKEQIFRLPRRDAYVGRTHEFYPLGNHAAEFPIARVWEVPKSKVELREKFNRDAVILMEDVARDPSFARGWFYLGESLSNLGDAKGAIHAHERCFATSPRPVESSWSAYRVAQLLLSVDKPGEALLWCERGLEKRPGMAELPALAAWICHTLGDYARALGWSERAIEIGNQMRHFHTWGFSDREAYFEGPYGTAAMACGVLGKVDLAAKYERERVAMKTQRDREVAG